MRSANDAAAPPLLPPAVRELSYGDTVVPHTGLYVWDPSPNSGVFVLPITMAPADLIRLTNSSSSSAIRSANIGDPDVNGRPLAAERSFTACGNPCIQPRYCPLANCESRSRASAVNASRSRNATIAFTAGLCNSI